MSYLKEQHLSASLSSDIATISSVVKIEDIVGYVGAVSVFAKYSAFKIIVTTITSNAYQWKSD